MQHLWSHQRRDFIDCAAGQVSLTQWCQEWIERIASIFHLNDARMEHYDPGLRRQTPAFDAAQTALKKALEALFAQGERELAVLPNEAREGKALRSLLNHRGGLCVFVDRPQVPMDNNASYSRSGISRVIPDHGLFPIRRRTVNGGEKPDQRAEQNQTTGGERFRCIEGLRGAVWRSASGNAARA